MEIDLTLLRGERQYASTTLVFKGRIRIENKETVQHCGDAFVFNIKQ